jgi:predicted dehydrogenase
MKNMIKRIGFGIIGCGAISKVYFENLAQLPEAEIIATADIDKERARSLAQQYRAKAWYTNYKELLENERVEAVCICLPPYLHAKIGVDALKAGKHTLIEKPLAINLKEADILIKAARKAGVKIGVAYQYRFNEAVRWAHEIAKSGEIGNLLLGNLWVKQYRSDEYYMNEKWRAKWSTAGGGVVMSNAIHWLDLLLLHFGPAKEVYAQMGTFTHNIEVEDISGGIIRFKSGAIGTFVASNSTKPSFPVRMDIHGDKGTIILEGESEKLHAKLFKKMGVEREFTSKELPKLDTPPFVPSEGHKPLIKDFLIAILENREPVVSGEEGRKSLEIVEAIYKSAKNNKVVRLL